MTGNLPPRRSPWKDPALANDPYARAFRDQLERAVSTPKVPEWERIATELKLVGELVANDRMSVDEAVVELDRRTDEILEKRRGMLDQADGPAGAETVPDRTPAGPSHRPRTRDSERRRGGTEGGRKCQYMSGAVP